MKNLVLSVLVLFQVYSLNSLAAEKHSVAFTSSTQPMTVFPGVAVELRWSFEGNSLTHFYIYKDGAHYFDLGSKAGFPTGVGSFLTNIPLDLPCEDNYEIVAVMDQDENVMSSMPIVCAHYEINVLGVRIKKTKIGKALGVQWDAPEEFKSNIYNSHVFIDVLKDGELLFTTGSNMMELRDGSYKTDYLIDESKMPLGNDYQFRIRSRYNSDYSDTSDVINIR